MRGWTTPALYPLPFTKFLSFIVPRYGRIERSKNCSNKQRILLLLSLLKVCVRLWWIRAPFEPMKPI